MRWVTLGLFSEGPTDSRFLSTLVYRQTYDLIAKSAPQQVELQEQVFSFKEKEVRHRSARICAEARIVDIFVVYADATARQRVRIVETIHDRVREEAQRECAFPVERVVELIPRREMESWALSDPDAIAAASGYPFWPTTVQPPWNPADVERISDPKRALQEALALLRARRKRSVNLGATFTLDIIAEHLRFERLERVNSFISFRNSMRSALVHLNVLQA